MILSVALPCAVPVTPTIIILKHLQAAQPNGCASDEPIVVLTNFGVLRPNSHTVCECPPQSRPCVSNQWRLRNAEYLTHNIFDRRRANPKTLFYKGRWKFFRCFLAPAEDLPHSQDPRRC